MQAQRTRRCAPDNRRRQRVFARGLDGGGEREHRVFFETAGRRDQDELRVAFGERACLVDDYRVDFLEDLECFGVLDQDAILCALAGTDHDGHRGRETQCTRTGDDEYGDGVHDRVGHCGLWTEPGPQQESDDGDNDDRWHEPCSDEIGEPLNRRPAALRFGDHVDDLRQHRIFAHAGRDHDETARAIDRTADDGVAGVFLDGNGLAADHGLVNRAVALVDDTVDRHFVTGTNTQPVALRKIVE